MLSLVDNGAPVPCPSPFNLAEHVLAAGCATPDRIALVFLRAGGAERWTYGRLADAVLAVAGGLLDRGLRPGDRLLLRLGNGVGFPLAFLGAIAAGIVPVPTPAGLTAPEVARVVALTRPAMIVAGPGIALPDPLTVPVLPEADLRGFEGGARADWAMGDPDRLAYVVMTSGTSGTARAVAHAHRVVWARRMMHQGWQGLGATDRLFHAGALNWTYTLGVGLLDPWAVGATAMVLAEGTGVAQIPLLLKRHQVSIFAAVPGVYRKILSDSPTLSLPHLRHGLSAGEKLPPALRAAWRAATGTDLHEAFGMSECSTFLSSSPTRPAPDGATGYAQPGRRIAVLGADGAPVERGVPGVLSVHREDPGLFLGFLAGETITVLQGDWFQTGDIVTMAEDGAVESLGRGDDMLNAGGFRVSPGEIEAAMNAHPGVTASAAVELAVRPDVTVIALAYTGTAEAETLEAHARTCLAPYKQPRLYLARDHLPVTANGKINRRALREEWKVTT
ncbi:MAG: acyl--CoA ligase [Proteobacteria bacterium]|nr:acyl--CoA ligase [Pseudomonadota bacterium]